MTVLLSDPPPLDSGRDALFLDFDGTLVALAPRPEAVVVPDRLIADLHRLNDRLAGRLAIVSGRAIGVLDGFGLAGLACVGSHGGEWRLAGGAVSALERPAALDRARTVLAAFAEEKEGVLFEDKPLGAALHYRLAPEAGADCRQLAEAHADGLHLQHGHEMIELRVPGANKGTAIAAMMERMPFAGHRPVFAGDDVTDEDGFRAVAEPGGHGILVGPPRASAAAYRLSDPTAVNQWLSDALVNAPCRARQ